jgi:hypothetical protein
MTRYSGKRDELLDKLREQREQMGSLYAESGGDVNACEFCEGPLDDSEPWKRGLDGAGAHLACIPRYS